MTAPSEIYTLSLHDALPISDGPSRHDAASSIYAWTPGSGTVDVMPQTWFNERSEEHTSELQSRLQLVCRLLLEKKNLRHAATAWVVSPPRPSADDSPSPHSD